MSDASVLVGIVTHNRVALLAKAIASALGQQIPDLKVAVLDDGSTDNTGALKDQFPDVHWTRWQENLGLIAARNFLMRSSAEDYFVSLDDDAWFLCGDEISVAVRQLEEDKQVAGIAFDILSPDRPQHIERTKAEPAAMFIGCGHVLRLAYARQVGFYESSPGIYGGEEKDLCLRLLDAGYRIDRLPGVHVWHEKSVIARHLPDQHRSGVCNDLAMTLRRAPLMILPAALAVKTLRHVGFSTRNGLLKPCLQGLQLFLRSIKPVFHARNPVKASTLRTFMRLSRTRST
jgi:GT2 family glycosyltransferase